MKYANQINFALVLLAAGVVIYSFSQTYWDPETAVPDLSSISLPSAPGGQDQPETSQAAPGSFSTPTSSQRRPTPPATQPETAPAREGGFTAPRPASGSSGGAARPTATTRTPAGGESGSNGLSPGLVQQSGARLGLSSRTDRTQDQPQGQMPAGQGVTPQRSTPRPIEGQAQQGQRPSSAAQAKQDQRRQSAPPPAQGSVPNR
jgi:hypothetical protein